MVEATQIRFAVIAIVLATGVVVATVTDQIEQATLWLLAGILLALLTDRRLW